MRESGSQGRSQQQPATISAGQQGRTPLNNTNFTKDDLQVRNGKLASSGPPPPHPRPPQTPQTSDHHNHHLRPPPAPHDLPTGTFHLLPQSIGTSISPRVNRGTDTDRQASLRRLQHGESQPNSQGGLPLFLLQGVQVALLRPGLATSSGRCSTCRLLSSSTGARRPTPALHRVNNLFVSKQTTLCLFVFQQTTLHFSPFLHDPPLTHACLVRFPVIL